jgi:hypothetical protein
VPADPGYKPLISSSFFSPVTRPDQAVHHNNASRHRNGALAPASLQAGWWSPLRQV